MAAAGPRGVHVGPAAASPAQNRLRRLAGKLRNCSLCADNFKAHGHAPRPIARLSATARICICSQAPGVPAHKSWTPFQDPSGVRLRDWMGVKDEQFYDAARIAIVPMGFCFPGRDVSGADLPPPAVCNQQWHARIFAAMPQLELFLLIGAPALRWHLGADYRGSVTETVKAWKTFLPDGKIPLAHPSWRNHGWLKRNPWFEAELLPVLKQKIRACL